jgi:tetratricopeptide (TPR) repeat protein
MSLIPSDPFTNSHQKCFCSLFVTAGLAMTCFAGNAQTPAAKRVSEQPSPQLNENSEETVTREFQGFASVPEFRGVIDDPDGYVNLRKDKRADAPVVTKVKSGERFEFQKKEHDDWCHVKLESGMGGWMHYSRIKLYFTKQDLPAKPEEGDEVDEQARARGINYYEVTQAAARGDQKALKTFLSFGGDGAAAEEHVGVSSVVIHLIGDDAFAKFLDEQSLDFCEQLISVWEVGIVWPFDTKEYFHQHFPKSAKFLLGDYDQLLRDYTSAIKRNPKDGHAYRKRGVIEYEKEEWDQAIHDFDRAIELNPKDDHAWDDRGAARAEKGEYPIAARDIQKAIELNGKVGDYHLDLGSCQLFNRKPRAAIAAALKALELDPDNATMINTVLATGYLFDNQFEKAKGIYLKNISAPIQANRSFSEVVLDDFKNLEGAGVTHPDIKKIKELLTSKTGEADHAEQAPDGVTPRPSEKPESEKH